MQQYKKCKECGEVKTIDNFSINRAYKDGHEARCRECRKQFRKKHTCKCEFCGKIFKSNIERKYCSIECSNKARNHKTIQYKCDICGKEINVIYSKYKINDHNYCSRKCCDIGRSRFNSGENSSLYKRVCVKCAYCGKEIYINDYRLKRNERTYCSKECKYKHQTQIFKGEKNPSYNPNLSDIDREKGRNIDGYKEWILGVYKKDNFTCQCCGNSPSDHLISHHLDGYNWCKEKRLDIDNGVTLCEDCHKEFHHIYGYGDNTKEQFEEFLKNKNIKVS